MTTDYRKLPYERLMLLSIWNEVYVIAVLPAMAISFSLDGWSGPLFMLVPFLLSEALILCITYSPTFHRYLDRLYRDRVLDAELKEIFSLAPADDHEHSERCLAYREINRLKCLLSDIAFPVAAAGIGTTELEYVDQIQFNYVTLWSSRQKMQDAREYYTDHHDPEGGRSKCDLKSREAMALRINGYIRTVEERMWAISAAVSQICQDLQGANEPGSWRPLRDRLKQLASENIWTAAIECGVASNIYEKRLRHIGLSGPGMGRTELRLRMAWLSFVRRLNRRARYKYRERELRWLMDAVSKHAPDDAVRHADLNGFDDLERLVDRAAMNKPTTGISSGASERVADARIQYLRVRLAEVMMHAKMADLRISHATEQDRSLNLSATPGSADEPNHLNERADLEKNIPMIHDWLQLISTALVDCANAMSFLRSESHMTAERQHFQPLHDALNAVSSLNDAYFLIPKDVSKSMQEIRRVYMDASK